MDLKNSFGKKKNMAKNTKAALISGLHRLLLANHGIVPTMLEIASESQVNAGLITYHFGGKDGLLFALLDSILGPRKDLTNALIENDSPPLQKLERYMTGLVNLYYEYPYINQLTLILVKDSPADIATRVSDELLRPVQANQQAILELAQSAGVLRDVDPMCFYFTMLGACERIFQSRYALEAIFGLSEITIATRDQYSAFIVDAMLNGLATQAASKPG